MARVRLTLSVERHIADAAKRLARVRGMTVSALFSRHIEALERMGHSEEFPIGPLTKQALGIARMPTQPSYEGLLEEGLAEKYLER